MEKKHFKSLKKEIKKEYKEKMKKLKSNYLETKPIKPQKKNVVNPPKRPY